MLKVTRLETPGSTVELLLEGQIAGPWVPELRRACREAMAGVSEPGSTLVLHLSGVSFVDVSGLELCRELAVVAVKFVGCSAFVAEQLREVSSC